MISMTGFAFIEKTTEDFSVAVEIKGYNSRFLELQIHAPPWLSNLEPKIRAIISGVCGRGKVDVFLRVKELNAPLNVNINTEAAEAYFNEIIYLANYLGIKEKPGLSTIIGMEGVLEAEKIRDDTKYWSVIEPVLREAVVIFQAERAREGKHTEEDILNSLSRIESALQTVKSRVSDLENSIKENIRARFKEIIETAVDENRILAETALILMKYTISEEISRLSSHLAEFRSETARNDKPGKKLDFLSQEINREINTIGSKSIIIEVSRAVVEMKEALENIREQLRNAE